MQNSTHPTRRGIALIALAALLFAAPLTAQAQPAFELQLLTRTDLRVAPGGSVAHALRIRNAGNSIGPARIVGSWADLESWDTPRVYLFGPASDARCGMISNPDPANPWRIEFTTAALEPGESLDCQWMINRPAQGPAFDAVLGWTDTALADAEPLYSFFGTLTHTVLTTRTLDFHIDPQGIGRSSIEMTVQNRGEHPIASQITRTCLNSGSGNFAFIDDTAGGTCGPMVYDESWDSCLPIPGPGSLGYPIPDLAPGQTYRCTFNARTRYPFEGPLGSDIWHKMNQDSPTAGLLLDPYMDEFYTTFIVGPTGSAGAPIALNMLDRLPQALLALIIAIAGLVSLSFARSRTSRYCKA